MKAARPSAKSDQPTPVLSPALRRRINDSLRPGFVVAVNYPPAKAGRQAKPHAIVCKLPRGSSGRPPSDGVRIPLPPSGHARMGRLGKHARQQARDGCFGSKKARLSIAAKVMLMWLASCEAIRIALERRCKRAYAMMQDAVDARAERFETAMQKGWGRVFGAKGV